LTNLNFFRTQTEQTLSADWSSLINKAYKTLLTPLERGEYLMKLQGIELPSENSSLDKSFLIEMMEKNEEVIYSKNLIYYHEYSTFDFLG
jgi:DnaJ-domain-containing protein 1